MVIQNIEINNLRCHRQRFFEFSENLNIIYGRNGIGKTTILEAISIASISKSFLPSSDAMLIRNGENSYSISLNALNALNLQYFIKVTYERGGRKAIINQFNEKLSPKEIIGRMPIVILSPDFKTITSGAPIFRRSFIDSILCQTSKLYFENLLNYKKCLKNRNNLLINLKKNQFFDSDEFNEWTNLLINYATEIIWKRMVFLREFIQIFINEYRKIANDYDDVNTEYIPFAFQNIQSLIDKNEIRTILESIAKKYANIEKVRYQTMFGPHKDDLLIKINGGVAKEYASQGQHKTLLIALKLAEFLYINAHNSEQPIVLFDDIFSELDENRSARVLELMDFNRNQVFITLTNPQILKMHKKFNQINFIDI